MGQEEKDAAMILAVPVLKLSPTMLVVLKELEQRMLKGYASHVNSEWMENEYKIEKDQFRKFEALVLHIWSESGVRVENFVEQRDKHRARYTDIYVKALESGKLATALRALDAISRMDGFDAPQQVNVNLNGRMITSEARTNVVSLLDKMKELAQKSVTSPAPSNGHSNGKNGKHVIDVDED